VKKEDQALPLLGEFLKTIYIGAEEASEPADLREILATNLIAHRRSTTNTHFF